MNNKSLDKWTFIHFLIGLIAGIILLTENFVFFVAGVFFVLFEYFEHLYIGNSLFEWDKKNKREKIINSILDITFGVIGLYIAYNFFN